MYVEMLSRDDDDAIKYLQSYETWNSRNKKNVTLVLPEFHSLEEYLTEKATHVGERYDTALSITCDCLLILLLKAQLL
jgi:hypothetical protein